MDEHTSVTEIAALADSFDRMLDRLEAAFHSQRAFVADASHELRTPLTAILGQAQVLAADPVADPAEVARVTGLIEREAERMGALIDGLLQLERLEAEGDRRAGAPFDLAARRRRGRRGAAHEQAARVELDAGDAVSSPVAARTRSGSPATCSRTPSPTVERRVAISVATEAGDGAGSPSTTTAPASRSPNASASSTGSPGSTLAEPSDTAASASASRSPASSRAHRRRRIEVGDSPLGGARMAPVSAERRRRAIRCPADGRGQHHQLAHQPVAGGSLVPVWMPALERAPSFGATSFSLTRSEDDHLHSSRRRSGRTAPTSTASGPPTRSPTPARPR